MGLTRPVALLLLVLIVRWLFNSSGAAMLVPCRLFPLVPIVDALAVLDRAFSLSCTNCQSLERDMRLIAASISEPVHEVIAAKQ